MTEVVGSEAAKSPPVERRRWPRAVVIVGGIFLLSAAVVARIGRFGFNPSDQGFILAQSWRVLHGEIPQVDVMAPRPFGSAYLHLVDYLVPAPLMIGSSWVMMVQLTVSTFALVAFMTGTSPLDWGPLRLGFVFAAALISLNTYPTMAWHTVDGVFLVAVGLWLLDAGLRSGTRWQRWLGLFCLGFAVIVKQSFMFAVPVGLLILFFHPARRSQDGGRWRRMVVDVLVLGSAPLLYFGMITLAGGLPSAIAQLTGSTGAWGEGLFQFWTADLGGLRADPRTYVLPVLVGMVVLGVAWSLRARLGIPGLALRLVTAACVVAVVVFVLIDGAFAHAGAWQLKLLWIFAAAAVLDAVIRRRLPWQYLLVALLGWMASLSWGYPLPGLITGALVLGTLEVVALAVRDELPKIRGIAGGAIGAIVLGLVAVQVVAAHDKAPYADRPQGELTRALGDVVPTMRGVRTNPSVHTYVAQIRECIDRYPASRVAVLPDNAFVAPVFGVRNPLPMDWPVPIEMTGDAPLRMVEAAERLNGEGDYLILFQTVLTASLIDANPVPAAVAPDAHTFDYTPVVERVRQTLNGARVGCGSFVGFWAPRR
ncbi:hypothetical protein AVL48_35570 [Amycolatopsis regifaucium]|uniref:Glycosyltransferase RgtA/B/C/D-like domain-containing protein n=1 Tax=Amycolatopsis regifaucium TaxID=546365 RepID=A0A154MIR8_9PSEU|nr:hypothetical protein AVL48_35570 [Amycolatopsis regifaucium]OKA06961.1 hypothetical protein ATP06_0219040 [Amycolatopsis regifaucium]